MQRASRQSVKVWQIFPRNRAEPVQIKMRVPDCQRIKRPDDEPNSPSQRFFALKEFQSEKIVRL